MRMKLAFLLLLLLTVGVVPAAAQSGLCQLDLSNVNALLTRAQAASAADDQAAALALVNRADTLLAAMEARCDLPEVTASVELGDTVSGGAFSLRLPVGWVADTETAAASGGLLIGTSAEVAARMADAEPVMASGEAGILIAYGTPSQLSGGALRSGDLETMARYFQILLSSQYLLRGDPAYIALDGRPAAELAFSGVDFAGHLVLIEVTPGVYATLAAAAAHDEMDALVPVVQSVAASITPAP